MMGPRGLRARARTVAAAAAVTVPLAAGAGMHVVTAQAAAGTNAPAQPNVTQAQPVQGPYMQNGTNLGALSRFCTANPLPAQTGGGAAGSGPQPMPAPTLDFAGLAEVQSPVQLGVGGDISGAAGPDNYVQTINDAIGIFDKQGHRLCPVVDTNALWQGAAAPCGNQQATYTDAIVLYDHAAGRWFVSRFTATDPNTNAPPWLQCIAISKTSDPTAGYDRFVFTISTPTVQAFNDYAKFGIRPDAYYMTANADKIFRPGGKGIYVVAFDRAAMLAGASSPRQVLFFIPRQQGPTGVAEMSAMLPADWDGPVPPPSGSPEPLAQALDDNLGFPSDQLAVWSFAVDWSNPAASTLGVASTFDLASLDSNACVPATDHTKFNQACILQPGQGESLDPLAYGYLGYRLAYRNLGDHEAMVLAQTMATDPNSPDFTGIGWYELRKQGANPWSIFQSGLYAPTESPQADRWLPSPAMDASGDVAIGFNVSDSVSTYPSIRYVGRQTGDPVGTLPRSEASLVVGGGAQPRNPQNPTFGDYNQMTVDPVDDCVLWFTASYYVNATDASHHQFSTRIGSFRFPNCAPAGNIPEAKFASGLVVVALALLAVRAPYRGRRRLYAAR